MEGTEITEKKPQKRLPALVGVLVLLIFVLIVSIYPNTLGKYKKYFLGGISQVTVTVENSAPTTTSVVLHGNTNSETEITLTENTTTSIGVTGDVTDYNSCKDLTSVEVKIYKGSAAGCTVTNYDTCYVWTDSTPASNSSCTGDSDLTYAVSHNFDIQYYADGGTWKTTVTPSDSAGPAGASESSAVTLNDLQSLSVGDIAYGSVAPGSNSTGDHKSAVKDTGNIAIDFNVKGTDLTCDGRGAIPVGNEQYNLASFSYGGGGATALTTGDVAVNGTFATPAYNNVPVAQDTYWQVGIPNGTKGTCSGTTTFTAIAAI